MTTGRPAIAQAAAPPVDSIVALAQRLVRIPSRGGEDDPEPILTTVHEWLVKRGVNATILHSPTGAPLAVVGEVVGGRPGSTYCLDACIDTAPFGDPGTWTTPPTSAAVIDGVLLGRGAADSKIAAAIFAHLAAELSNAAPGLSGRLLALFDADEHTGRFAGARTFLAAYPELDGVMIGYPGKDSVVIGARGFYRATLHVHGVAGHSGSSRRAGVNAIEKASALVQLLGDAALPGDSAATFPLPPSLTVTAIEGGGGFTTIPDLCRVQVDMRLTPTFGERDARVLLTDHASAIDQEQPSPAATRVEELETWPAYRLESDSPLVTTLVDAARRHIDPSVRPRVCGPSNIGNLCAAHGVPATCGLGVGFEGVHSANETACVADVASVYYAYREATVALMARA
jgi:succinyl-diaminopimelate desuccinylase